jgi:hypothetical protein
MNQIFYTGVVESRTDNLFLGRCKVRVVGLHTADKGMLPTSDLPWAHPIMPTNSASMNGLGWSPTGIVPGTWVIIIFMDEYLQQPMILGTIGGIPQTASAKAISDISNGVVTTDGDGDIVSETGDVLTDIISSIVDNTSPSDGTSQSTGSRYQVNAVIQQLSDGTSKTTYNVIDIAGTKVYATATYDETTLLYSVMLLNASDYTTEQYTPFAGGAAPVTFVTTQAIADYFDINF